MLMLRHVYRKSPRLLEDVLKKLLQEKELGIGPRFEQQVGVKHSRLDAVLNQEPLHIYIEVKRGDDLNDGQLKQHMLSIAEKNHPSNSAFLVGITRKAIGQKDNKRWKEEANDKKITFVATTYEKLLKFLTKVCAEDSDLLEILGDYETFIGKEDLLPDQHRKLVAVPCTRSLRENIKYGIYFEPASIRPKWKRAHFIGTYHGKRISHVGRLDAVAVCQIEDDELIIISKEFGELTDDHKERIQGIIEAADYFPDVPINPYRYYLVDHFEETDVRKESRGPMRDRTYNDIRVLAGRTRLSKSASSKKVAGMLSGTAF